VREYALYIDGAFAPSSSRRTFDSINPFNRETTARVALATIADAQRAVVAARKAFDDGPWRTMQREERAALLKSVSDKLNERKNEFAQLEVEDSGSTIRKAKEDVYLSARAMNYYSKLAALDLSQEIEGLSKPGFSRNLLLREPIGVVAAIIPWNFPLKMAIWKLGPALAAGNTVVLKPSELTPVTAMELANIFHDVGFPPGVVNVIPGLGEDVGEELVRNPMVDKVSFTGSTAIGKRVMQMASGTLKKCTLECGGKSANIILDDADIDMAVDGTLYGVYYHQGQCCEAATRLFLPNSLHDEFLARLVTKAGKIKLGDPNESSTDMGPVISERQQDRVLGYIKSGIGQGATLSAGGHAPLAPELQRGFFVEPTIFSNVGNRMIIAQEEIFGPVLSVIRYNSEAEAVAMANDSLYGLGGGVWSRDPEKALTIARQLRAGTVWINEWHLLSEKAPFGGYKQSGIGREFGLEGLHEYTESKHLHIDEVGVREKKPWYDVVVPKL
jgi:aldehyde dehydrogenase (NAD+)